MDLDAHFNIPTPGLKRNLRITFSRSRKYRRENNSIPSLTQSTPVVSTLQNNSANNQRPLGLLGPLPPKRGKSLERIRNSENQLINDLAGRRNFNTNKSFEKKIVPPIAAITPSYSQEQAFKAYREKQCLIRPKHGIEKNLIDEDKIYWFRVFLFSFGIFISSYRKNHYNYTDYKHNHQSSSSLQLTAPETCPKPYSRYQSYSL